MVSRSATEGGGRPVISFTNPDYQISAHVPGREVQACLQRCQESVSVVKERCNDKHTTTTLGNRSAARELQQILPVHKHTHTATLNLNLTTL